MPGRKATKARVGSRGNTKREAVLRPIGPQYQFEVHRLGAELFEEMCCALWGATETNVVLPDLYGSKYRAQFGIDVLADRKTGDGIEGISCKCYKSLSKGDLARFSDEFLDHWDVHWKSRRFQRFILCVACNVSSHERRKEIELEKARFAALGVEYEVWSQRTLSNKLHTQPSIRLGFGFQHDTELVTQQLARFEQHLTGASAVVLATPSSEGLQSALDQAVTRQLDRLRDLLRGGDAATVRAELTEISNSPQWSALAGATRARVLRMRAMQVLDDAPAESSALLDQADALHPVEDNRPRALLALRTRGPERALDLLPIHGNTANQLLRAALLIELARFSDAEALLMRVRSECADDAEWHRLFAFVTSLTGRAPLAIEAIERAQQLAPTWVIVEEAAGRVHFAAAMPPHHIQTVRAIPEPADCELLRQDAIAQDQLRKAIAHFESAARLERGMRSHSYLALWALACAVALPDRRESASMQCLALLDDPRLRPHAVAWALYGGFPFDHAAVIRSLEQTLRENPDAAEALQALVLCALAQGDPKKAAAAIQRFRARARDERALSIAQMWASRVALYRGESLPDDAQLEPMDRMQRLAARALVTQDWAGLAQFLSDGDLSASDLFFGCKLLAANRQWASIAPHLERLLAELDTHSVIRLAAYVWYHTRAFDRVVHLLTEKLNAFPASTLPYDLQRIKAFAAAGRGDLTTARAVANSLLARSGAAPDRQFAIELALRGGDVSRATELLRESLHAKALTPKQALRYLPSVATDEPELARQIVRQLLSKTLDKETGGRLIQWSYRLGLDAELRDLWRQVSVANLEAVGLRHASLAELEEVLRAQRATAERLNAAYQRGDGPIHALLDTLNINLAVLWNDVFERQTTTLFIRSGNRPRRFFASTVGYVPTLVLDLTAVLSCDHLDLWDDLARAGCHLMLPHRTLLAINELEQTARHNQPRRIRTQREVTHLLNASRLIADDAAPADRDGRASIVFACDGEADLPRVSLGALADHLIEVGRVPSHFKEHLQDRHSYQVRFAELDLHTVQHLHFEANTIQELVDAQLFEATASVFTLHAEREYVREIAAEIDQADRGDAVAERLKRLRQRLRDALETRSMTLLPESPAQDMIEPDDRTLAMSLVKEVLSVPATERTWLWIDDRYCTSYTVANGNHIVSTMEVLDLLHERGVIDERRLYSFTHLLRQSHCSFVPFDAAEVMHRLAEASVRQGEVVETPALRDIRRSFNRFLLNNEWLNFEQAHGRQPEFACLLNAYSLARTAIEEIWSRAQVPIDSKHAWSDWVWLALRVEYVPRLPVGGTDADRQRLWRMSIVHLIVIGLCISIRHDMGQTRQAYFEWLQTVIPDVTDRGDPNVLQSIALEVRKTLLELIWRPAQAEHTSEERRVLELILGAYVAVLPPLVQEIVLDDEELRAAIGSPAMGVVELRQHRFPAERFWAALASLPDDQARTIETVDHEQFVLKRGANGISLTGTSNMLIADRGFDLLSDALETRSGALARYADQLLEADRERICAEPSAATRMRLFEEARERTPAGRYALITANVSGQFDPRLLRPASVAAHAAYLGIDVAATSIDWANAAERLQHLDGAKLLRRWTGLPIRLPSFLGDRLNALSSDHIAKVIDSSSGATTPLRLVLALECCNNRLELADHRAAIVARILGEWRERTEAFIASLRCSERMWKKDEAWHRVPVAVRLALVWSHADRMLESLLAGGVPLAKIVNALSTMESPGVRYDLPIDPSYEGDIAAPSTMSSEVLLLHAFCGLDLEATLMPPARDALFSLMSRVSEDERLATIHMFEDRRSGPNALESYLVGECKPWLQSLYDDDRLFMVRASAKDDLRQRASELARSDMQNGTTWVFVSGVGWRWFPIDERSSIEDAMRQFQFPAGSASKDNTVALLCLARAIPFLSEPSRTAIRSGVLGWAKSLSDIHRDRLVQLNGSTAASQDALLVAEILCSLARWPEFDRTYQELAANIRASINVWPGLAGMWRPLMDRLFLETPSSKTQSLWSDVVLLRAHE